jgi:hypothetical protein
MHSSTHQAAHTQARARAPLTLLPGIGCCVAPQNRQAHRLTAALEMYTSSLEDAVKALHRSPHASQALAHALLGR